MEEVPLKALVFDIDDTLYDVGTGFTAHRNGAAVGEFMCTRLLFPSIEEAMQVRNDYFAKYHATAKALTVAESEGKLPAGAHFEVQDLAEWWATKLNYELLEPLDPAFIEALARCPLKLIAFTNAPRKYGIRVLETLGIRHLFPDNQVFAVDDVLPHCKPEPAAFDKVLGTLGLRAEECIMVEDSMKNIRAAKALGMKTVLVRGAQVSKGGPSAAAASEATKPGDQPLEDDPAVDVTVEVCLDLVRALPGLWRDPPVFSLPGTTP